MKQKPLDPSPTPGDHSTWGFYCDDCDVFFDLIKDGKVITHDGNFSVCYHSCGSRARYITYDQTRKPSLFLHQTPEMHPILDNQALLERVAQLLAHRVCCAAEHDPMNGKIHGFCVVCGESWPCAFAGKPPQ